ncbi:MAG: fatty acid desaturase [Myxococcota bacterium]
MSRRGDTRSHTDRRNRRRWWQTLPSAQYRHDPFFYFRYDGMWFAAFVLSGTALRLLGWRGISLEPSLWLIPLALGSCYFQALAGVCIHNAAHQNFPRAVNRVVGELLGVVVATRFASWEILHRRHHLHSDDETKDPHAATPTFVGFLIHRMILNLEPTLHARYFELWGDTPTNRRRELVRSIGSFTTMLALFYFWFCVLGETFFVLVYLPGLVFGVLHVSHFNWITHDGSSASRAYRPTDLDHGVYWIANRILFGLYMHARHHAFARAFNPLTHPACSTKARRRPGKPRRGRAAHTEDQVEHCPP